MSNWQQVEIFINRTALEGAYGVLDKWEIESYAVDDSALMEQAREFGWGDYFPETAYSDQVAITCYFPEHKLSQTQLHELKRDLLDLEKYGFEPGLVVVSEGEVNEADWAHAWKAYYHPLRIGQVWIQPSWEKIEEDGEDKIIVQLDPGMAFGSGTHPTTAMCVELLQGLNLEERILWDVGTGSGILAIVAAKLGAQVQAVDIDPVAVKVARENRDRNGLSFPIEQGTLGDLTGKPEVIVANIVAHVIGPMLPDVYKSLEPEGFFLAAGVIRDKDSEILALAKEAGLCLLRRVEQGEWVGYLFLRGD